MKQRLDPGRATKFLAKIETYSDLQKESILLKCHIAALEEEIERLRVENERLQQAPKIKPI